MYQLMNDPFQFFHPSFFEREFLPLLVTRYAEEALSRPVPDLGPMYIESRFVVDYELLRTNIGYRLAGTEPYPDTFDAFTETDLERVRDDFQALEPHLLEDYVGKFMSDCYKAHELVQVTHVVTEPSFMDGTPCSTVVLGTRGGGFSCII